MTRPVPMASLMEREERERKGNEFGIESKCVCDKMCVEVRVSMCECTSKGRRSDSCSFLDQNHFVENVKFFA